MINIDSDNFYKYFAESSSDFSVDPKPICSSWDEIRKGAYGYDFSCDASIIAGVSRGGIERARNDICLSFNRCAKRHNLNLEIEPSDSPKEMASNICQLTRSFREKDTFINTEDFIILLDDGSRNAYLSNNDECNKLDSPNWGRALMCSANIFDLVKDFYLALSSFEAPITFATKHKESLIKFFTGRNIRLATGELDHEAIRKLLMKNFGINSRGRTGSIYSRKYYTPLVSRLLSAGNELPDRRLDSNMKGREFEVEISNAYKTLGYNVTITKYSGDFGVDVIAESNTEKIGIQCKNFESVVGVDAVMQAYSGGKFYDCTRCCVITSSNFTEPAREMANKLGVEMLIYSGERAP